MAEPNSDTSPSAMMRELWVRWLTDRSLIESENKGQSSSPNKVLAALVDWPIGDHIATVLAASSGDAPASKQNATHVSISRWLAAKTPAIHTRWQNNWDFSKSRQP
jgi:hypothetical protein